VLRLADQLRAERCEAAAACALAAASPLDWSTVLAAYSLPPSCSENAAYQPLFDAAATALQQQLSDLDAAWLDDGKVEVLLALPYAAVKQLLSDDHTRACENTVYYTCCAWIEKHMYTAGAEQRSELLECVRMPHVSSLYLATTVSRTLSQLTDSISPSDVHCAAAYVAASETVKDDLRSFPDLPFTNHPTWLLPKRPPSAVQSVVIEWRVPLSELKQLHEAGLAKAVGKFAEAFSPRSFGGVAWSYHCRQRRRLMVW